MGRVLLAQSTIAEMARTIPSRLQFRAEVIKILDEHIGYTDSMFHLLDPDEPFARGYFETVVSREVIVEAQDGWRARYNPELAPLWAQAEKQRGVVVDSLVLGPDSRNRLRFYREIMSRTGVAHLAWCPLYVHGTLVAQIVLARRGAGFDDAELEPLRELRPVIAIAEACYRTSPQLLDGEMQSRLTARELEIVDLLIRGLTNPEIAAVLNLSLHTVRNHLNRVFQKLNVSTRAELAGLGGGRSSSS